MLTNAPTAVPPGALLRVAQLNKSYQDGPQVVRACDCVDLAVHVGELCWIRGSSGSGKSTLLLACAGLVAPDSGAVEVDGLDIVSVSESRRTRIRLEAVGVVFQDFLLVEEFSAADNVRLPLEARGWTLSEAMHEARRWLEVVGLVDAADRLPSALSGGQRQRVGIARALAGGRRLILADEPTGALDSTTSREIFDLLARLAREGAGIVLASHDPQAARVATRTLVMVDGRLEETAG